MAYELKRSARAALRALDGFLAGADLTDAEGETQKAVSLAGSFAAAAYEAAPSGGADVHALTRTFLLALIDPDDAALDYLRTDPASGAVAREAADQLRDLTSHPKGAPNDL